MRKRRAPISEPVIPSEILKQAKQTMETDRVPNAAKCIVCGAACPSNPNEELCWVCRRLKISAWHESEQQMPAQE